MTSRIEQIIDEIEKYISNCKHSRLSNSNIIVNKNEFDEMLTELRLSIPDEISTYKKMLERKDSIITEAKAEADKILKLAAEQTSVLVNDNEIMKLAYEQADELVRAANAQAQDILANATDDANEIRYSAILYTDDMLKNIEYVINHSIDAMNMNYKNMAKGLQDSLQVVSMNRAQLVAPEEDEPQQAPPPQPQTPQPQPENPKPVVDNFKDRAKQDAGKNTVNKPGEGSGAEKKVIPVAGNKDSEPKNTEKSGKPDKAGKAK